MNGTAAIGAMVTVAVLLAGCASGGSGNGGLGKRTREAADARAEQAKQAAARAGLDPAVQDFVASAAGVAGQEFSVNYDLGQPGHTTVVIQQPPFRRVEVRDPTGVQVAIDNADGSFSCRQPAGAGWTCQRESSPTTPGGFSLDQLAVTADALSSARASFDFAVDRRTIAATSGRCLTATRKTGADVPAGTPDRSVLCISSRGATLLVDTGGPVVKATRYSTKTDGRAFTLPAPVARTG
jgi:hypothetical protein